MILSDFHVHSNFSPDSEATIHDQVLAAINKKLKYICLTDHLEFPDTILKNQVNEYINQIQDLKTKFQSQINILTGLEVSLDSRFNNQISNFIKSHHFDFIIASQHAINDKDLFLRDCFENRREQDVFGDYFENILHNIKSFSDYNVLGHTDYIIRYAPNKDKYFNPSDYYDLLTQIFKIIIEQNKGIEINSSALKHGFENPHPSKKILELYKNLGGEIITIGSDAHHSDYIGYEFDQLRNLLRDIGFKYYTVFQNQKPKFLKI